uniref:Uncharacterized protein n=2 Tax=Oryza TaxID=4527 RepID=A0A0D3EWY6_9ORYZ
MLHEGCVTKIWEVRELFNLEALEHEVHYEPEEVPNSHKLAIRECPVQSNRVLQRGPNGLAM